jgi:hypothetical protein
MVYAPGEGLRWGLLSDSFQWERGLFVERKFFIQVEKKNAIRGMHPGVSGAGRAAAFGLAKDRRHRAIPFLPAGPDPSSDPLFQRYLEVTDQLLCAFEKERRLWCGFRDFGDYRMACGWFANEEFDPAYGLLKRFLLLGRFEDLMLAEQMLDHWLRFDRTTTVDDGFPPGLPWMHHVDHHSGLIETGHMWVDGALLFGLMTGEASSIQAALDIGKYLVHAAHMGSRSRIPERSAAWALMALTALKGGGCRGFDEAMNRLAARIRERQTDEGYFRFDDSGAGSETGYRVNAWVTAGITMEALYRHGLLTGDERSFKALLAAGAWLKRASWDPKRGKWFQNFLYDGNDPSLMLSRSGTVRKEDAAFLALGLARAGSLGGDDKLLRSARRTLEEGLGALRADPPDCPGRALAVVLRCAPEVVLLSRKAQARRFSAR